jgi:hypothetical protein
MGSGEVMGYVEIIPPYALDVCDLCAKRKPRNEGHTVRADGETLLWICKECYGSDND